MVERAASVPARLATPGETGASELGSASAEIAKPRPHVLLDALNRDLETGTGIATYSRLLAATLQDLGYPTSWLFGRHMAPTKDPFLGEVLFHDITPPTTRLGRIVQSADQWRRSLFMPEQTATRIPMSQAVVRDPNRPFEHNAYNVSRVYQLSQLRHSVTGNFTSIRPPPGVDILHLTSPIPIRMRGVKNIITIHDLIPLRLPYTTLDNKREYLRRLRGCISTADLILTVSECSKRDICSLLQVPESKVHVTYQYSDMRPFKPSERHELSRVLRRYGIEAQRYALFVGAIEPKKNLRRLIEAFLETAGDIPLVIVGKKAWMWEAEIGNIEAVFGPRALRRLRFFGHVAPQDLRILYSGAMFLAFPSLYEGFGLPTLEAMMSGCPVLTSNSSSLPEVCGDAAVYVDPLDKCDITEKLERIMQEPDLRSWMSTAGLEQAKQFSAAAYAERLNAAYETVF